MAANMVVRTNVFSLNAHRNMKNVGLEQRRASNRLSSGYRINSAADDAAGLAISENMRAQIRGLDQASRNAQDGQAMILTTEGGLEEIGNMVQRVRELIVQASNDTNTQNQRDMINQEIGQLGQEIFSMQQRVEFNTNRVLAMGPGVPSTVNANIAALQIDNLRISAAMDALDSNRALVNEAIEMLNAVTNPTAIITDLNARQRALLTSALAAVNINNTTAGAGLASTVPGGTHATGDITGGQDANLVGTHGITAVTVMFTGAATTMAAGGTGNGTLGSIALLSEAVGFLNDRLTQINGRVGELNVMRSSMVTNAETNFGLIENFRNATSSGDNVAWFQVGANSAQGIQFDFEDVSRAVTSATAVIQSISAVVANPDAGTGIGRGIEITPFINQLQTTLDDIGSVRANLGAVQNRMDYTMRSLDISSENLQDSESRVRNADIAREMMSFTMSNVLQQAAVSMLAQANQLPNNLMQLLR